MREVSTRTLAGVAYVMMIIVTLYYSFSIFSILLSIFVYVGCSELGRMIRMDTNQIYKLQFIAVISYFIMISPVFFELGNYNMIPIGLVTGTMVAFTLLRQLKYVFSMLYLVVPLALFSYTGRPDFKFDGTWQYATDSTTLPTLLIFILVWTSDTFAYISGNLFGKHPMAPKISPKKTWEGFWGSMLFSIVAAGIVGSIIDLPLLYIIPLSIITCITATLGDLFESTLKRRAGIKDSGTIMPGHGGILDRIDGILMTVPFALTYMYIYNQF